MKQKLIRETNLLPNVNDVDETPLYLNMKKFVKATGLSVGLIERLIREGKLECIIIGRIRFIPRHELERLPEILNKI